MKKVGIVNYGVGNYQAVSNAIMLAGSQPFDISCRSDFSNLDAIILPGVGHYDVAFKALRAQELDKYIQNLSGSKIPIIGICLGFHLMGSGSAEAGGKKGLNIFNEKVQKNLYAKVNTGWRDVENSLTGKKEKYYFNHGYNIEVSDHTIMSCKIRKINTKFSAFSAKDNFFGLQFHLEKSGAPGINLLEKLLQCDL